MSKRRTGALRVGAVLVLLAVVGAGTAGGDVVNLVSIKDNTLYEVSGPPMSNGAGQYMFAGSISSGYRRRALLQFDIAGAIPAGSTITNVQLTLYMSKTTSAQYSVELRRLLASWGEGTSDSDTIGGGGQGAPATSGDATWENRFHPGTPWVTEGGDFAAVASATTNVNLVGFYTWTSTPALVADVQGWLSNPASNFGWTLLGDESVAWTSKRFDTRENTTASRRPRLTVTYLPPPACACLADLNSDSKRDGKDIQWFVSCLLVGGANCPCADVNGGGLDASDIAPFVDQVLAGVDCP